MSQSPASVLAPTGTLRAVFLGSNPVHGRVDAKTGVPTGPVPDLVRGTGPHAQCEVRRFFPRRMPPA